MLGVYTSVSRTYVVICGMKIAVGDYARKFKLPDGLANNAEIAAIYVRKHLNSNEYLLACLPAESLNFISEIEGLILMPIGGNVPVSDITISDELIVTVEDEDLPDKEEALDAIETMRAAVGNDNPPPFKEIQDRIQEEPDDKKG